MQHVTQRLPTQNDQPILGAAYPLDMPKDLPAHSQCVTLAHPHDTAMN